MSTQLPSIDLTGAVVGGKYTMDFNQFVKFNPAQMAGLGTATYQHGNSQSPNAHLFLFNESGAGLNATLNVSGQTFYLPAGGWGVINVAPNDATCKFVVSGVIPNAPISLLTAVYYAPGEEVPNNYALGNSPIGVTGSVATSSVQTLSNEGAASNTLVIDMGDVAFSQLLTMYNDGHAIWSVDQSSVKHQAIKIQTSGNPLQLGQTGDNTEVLGALLVDQTLTTTGSIIASTDIKTNIIRDNVTAVDQIDLTTAGITVNKLLTVTGTATFNNASPSIVATNNVSVTTLSSSQYQSNGFDLLGVTSDNKSAIINAPNLGSSGIISLRIGGVQIISIDTSGLHAASTKALFFATGSITGYTRFLGTGNGTVATGLTNPFQIFFNPCSVSGSSQTIGGTNASSSVVTTGAGLAWVGSATN